MEHADYSRSARKLTAIKKIHNDFKAILKHEKCRTCACFYGDVLNGVYERIKKFRKSEPTESDQRLVQIENDFERWIRDAAFLKMHG